MYEVGNHQGAGGTLGAMGFVRRVWANLSTGGTPIDADALNRMEVGLEQAAGPNIHVVTESRFSGGAKGNGTADDTAAIQAAITAASQAAEGSPPRGGVVYFPAGIYRITGKLTVPARIYLVGENTSSTRILYDGATLSTDALITFGVANQISVNSGIRWLAVDAAGKAAVTIRLYGPQEGSHLMGSLITGATQYTVDVISQSMAGGSNKFVIEKCWIWTIGDAGEAAINFGPGAGPVSIRDTTCVGVNRPSYATSGPAGTAGIKTRGGYFLIDNVNVEHFESHTNATSTNLIMNTPTSFFCAYGVTLATSNTPLIVENASFDSVTACMRNTTKGWTVPFFVNYRDQAYESDRRSLVRNFWAYLAENIYSGTPDREAQLGYSVYGNGDTNRFKINTIRPDGAGWIEAANVDASGTFGFASSAWNGAHARLGDIRLWFDSRGRLRSKSSAPNSELDGSIINSNIDPAQVHRPPVGGAIAAPVVSVTTAADAIGTLNLTPFFVPQGVYDAAIVRVTTAATGGSVKVVAYDYNPDTSGVGSLAAESAQGAATATGNVTVTFGTALVSPVGGRTIWLGAVNQGSAAATFSAVNNGSSGFAKVIGTAANVNLSLNNPTVAQITSVTGAAPASPGTTYAEASTVRVALRRSA